MTRDLTPKTSCPSPQTLAAHYDREVRTVDRPALEQHIATCPLCRSEIIALEALSRQLHEDGLSDMAFSSPSAFWTRLSANLQPRAAGSLGAEQRWPLLAPLGLVLTGAALQLVGVLVAWADSAQRLHWIQPAWSQSAATVVQQLAGPLAWSAVEGLERWLSSVLPAPLGQSSVLSLAVQVGSSGAALGLAALYFLWVAWWVRDADRIDGHRPTSQG